MLQTNKHNAQIGETFYFKNDKDYTFQKTVVKTSDKSVYYTQGSETTFRESWNTFNTHIEKYLLERKKND